MTIQRYDIVSGEDWSFGKMADGDWVKFSEVAALAAQAERVKAERLELDERLNRQRFEITRLLKECEGHRERESWLMKERVSLEAQLESVCGALADAGTVLAVRTDGNYGESVRTLTKERDKALAELAALRERVGELEADERRMNAIQDRSIIDTIDFAGTTVPYWNVFTASGKLFTTADGVATRNLRQCIDVAITDSMKPKNERE